MSNQLQAEIRIVLEGHPEARFQIRVTRDDTSQLTYTLPPTTRLYLPDGDSFDADEVEVWLSKVR
jgi:hypothetical protein